MMYIISCVSQTQGLIAGPNDHLGEANMQSNKDSRRLKAVYYVEGSGLFPVPADRVSEIPNLRRDHHQREVEAALRAAMARRVF